jgi:3-oxoacyl-[acyl-carrier protein] reductase
MGNLDGKAALVTGGSRGIGAAIARRLAAEGADVAITYTNSQDAAAGVVADIGGYGRSAAAYSSDQADADAVGVTIAEVIARFGRLDILVNSAGIFRFGAVGTDALDSETSARQIDVNYRGVLNATRAAAPVLADGGRIINVGANTGTGSVLFPGLGEYAATKAAVVAYSKGAARDLGARGITVNVVQPGPIATDMNPDDSDWAEQLKRAMPLGRYGTPGEVAELVVFLAGPHASFITGATITIDGGVTA